MGVRNSVQKGILHAVNGSFSAKWATVSRECGFETDILNYKWGKGIVAEDVDQYLSTGKYDVFAMVHNETSTGVMSDLNEIAHLLKTKYPNAYLFGSICDNVTLRSFTISIATSS